MEQGEIGPSVVRSSLGVNIAPLLPHFAFQNLHFRPENPDNPRKYQVILCLKRTQIAEIFASSKKSGLRNTMATSDLRPEVELEIRQYNPYLWPNRRNFYVLNEIEVEEHDGDVKF